MADQFKEKPGFIGFKLDRSIPTTFFLILFTSLVTWVWTGSERIAKAESQINSNTTKCEDVQKLNESIRKGLTDLKERLGRAENDIDWIKKASEHIIRKLDKMDSEIK